LQQPKKKVNFSKLLRIKYESVIYGDYSGFGTSGVLSTASSTEEEEEEDDDDDSIEVTMDLPQYDITAVSGPSKVFQYYNLKDHPAVERMEVDSKSSVMGFMDSPPVNSDGLLSMSMALNQTTLLGENENTKSKEQSTEFIPYGIDMVQSTAIEFHPQNKLKICVVDTGYNLGHVDLPKDGVVGIDDLYAYPKEPWSQDDRGHGTHVAGVISALKNNVGLVGINDEPDKFSLLIGKGLSSQGWGYNSVIMNAVSECTDQGARVVVLSLGGDEYSAIQDQFYRHIYNQGVLVVAAAGNSGTSSPMYPAYFPTVMSVAAVDISKTKAKFSNYNSQVEISAPGVQIASTFTSNKYAWMSGTSMAAPHVAGVALKVWSWFPHCTNTQIRNVLLKTAQPTPSQTYSCDSYYGHGLVRAQQAMELL
jgi:subtilisin family serine protease